MYLNETILQSTTTLTLVKYIDSLWEFLELCDPHMTSIKHLDQYEKLERKYHIIKDRANKASKKRSFK